MDNEKMARFIAELRKEKKLTQRDLANKLGVTDKAVSKWERGLSCPDIAILSPLSDILGITTTELLKGEKTAASTPEVETVVEATLQFADTVTKHKTKEMRAIIIVTLSIFSLSGIVICTITNFAISGRLTWALFPISSIIFIWLIIIPGMAWNKNGIFASLVAFSVFIVPFLFTIEKIIGTAGLIIPIGIKASVIAVVYLWGIFILFFKTRLHKYAATAFSALLAIPVSVGINYTVGSAIQGQSATDIWDILTYSILLMIAIILLCVGNMKHKTIFVETNGETKVTLVNSK